VQSWILALELPGNDVLVDESEDDESSRSSPIDPSARPWSPVGASQSLDTTLGEPQTPLGETTAEHPVPSFFEFKPEFSPTPTSRTASLVPDVVDDGIHQAPSALDPLGPLGLYPYLISNVQDDDENLIISCRPCGPRLFDLVAGYPMSDYGLTSWSLLERDEELFEIDDIRDEEKAMQALWNRWIFSKRRRYLLDPPKAVMEFVDCFLPTIMKTAGWKGMRVWLLLLAKHRYLTGDDVISVMNYYERVANIET